MLLIMVPLTPESQVQEISVASHSDALPASQMRAPLDLCVLTIMHAMHHQ